MGKGGTAGAIKFPDYIETIHSEWLWDPGSTGNEVVLTTSVAEEMNTLFDPMNNPFNPTTATLTDPAANFTAIQTALDTWRTKLTSLDEKTEWAAQIDALKDKLDEAGILTSLAPATYQTDGRTEAGTEITAAWENATAQDAFDEAVDWPALFDVILGKINAAGLDPDSAYSVVEQATQATMRAMECLLDTLNEYADDGAINDLVNAYVAQAELGRARALNQFAGQMADMNAVHGSAFVIGTALINAQHEADINRFRAEQILGQRNSLFNVFGTTIAQNIQAHTNIALDSARQKATLVTNAMQSILAAYSGRQQLELALTQLHATIWQAASDQFLRAEIVNKSQRDSHIQHGNSLLVQMMLNRLRFEGDSVNYQYAINAAKTAGTRDYELDQINLDKDYALWNLKIFEAGAAILGAPSGMAAVLPPGTSRVGSALSGALGGAASGAAIGTAIAPGIGSAVGAGIGAVVGGVAGLLNA